MGIFNLQDYRFLNHCIFKNEFPYYFLMYKTILWIEFMRKARERGEVKILVPKKRREKTGVKRSGKGREEAERSRDDHRA